MTPKLIGYFPKRTAARPDWLTADVQEVCSASECVSSGPKGWIGQWKHNELFLFDSPEVAEVVITPEQSAKFEMYAFRMYPVRFHHDGSQPFAVPALAVMPLPDDYERLGFDAVSKSCGTTFECSPLSCNNLAGDYPVNRYCLLDDASSALELAATFARTQPEPGPYFVVEVWQKRK
jgi:hypothetical protein